ncbi:hypothetical protein HDU91_001132 [Kappamyces sp. JEL0680]|nr:hypothetical protein HDU91_001132 [Kappamyces sp. JEL0680]
MQDNDSDDEDEWLFSLLVEFTPNYPEQVPGLEIESIYLTDPERQEVHDQAMEQCRETVGDAMIYTICSWLKERIEKVIEDRMARLELEHEQAKARAEEEEKKRYQGTKVTPESFLVWQKAFVEEAKTLLKQGRPLSMAFQAALAVEKLISTNTKPTGKQLFEQADASLLKSDEAYGDEGAEVEVDASLLHGMQNMDIEEENAVLAGFTEDD